MTLQEATTRYPNMLRIGSDGIPELYADNHILQMLRQCEAMFVENFIHCIHPRGDRSWSLEFGIWTHSWLEHFYKNYKSITCQALVDYGSQKWLDMEMQYFVQQPKLFKTCADLGGLTGAVNLMVHYFMMYGEQREKLNIIATEVAFGREKEVPILEHPLPQYRIPFRAYYCGRMDAISDDGICVSPCDHKTTSTISPNTGRDFNPHEGIEGYVYALSKIYKRYFPSLNRIVNQAIVNHLQVKYTAQYADRFKRTTIPYSPAKLEQWRLRQIRTFKRMYDLLVNEESPDWNTQTCHNIYNYPCSYRTLHEADPVNRQAIIDAHYVQIEPWNTYKIKELKQEVLK